MKLADLFEVSVDYLLGRTDHRNGGVTLTPASPAGDRVLKCLVSIEAVKQTTSRTGKLAEQIEEHKADIKLIKKVLAKE